VQKAKNNVSYFGIQKKIAMRIYTKKHIEEKAARQHQRKILERGGLSRSAYLSQPYKGHMGAWIVTYWFRDKIEIGDKVRLKKETFTDVKPSFYLEFKDKIGIVQSQKWFSKHPSWNTRYWCL
jgi:hypothetical protein